MLACNEELEVQNGKEEVQNGKGTYNVVYCSRGYGTWVFVKDSLFISQRNVTINSNRQIFPFLSIEAPVSHTNRYVGFVEA